MVVDNFNLKMIPQCSYNNLPVVVNTKTQRRLQMNLSEKFILIKFLSKIKF